MVSFYDDNGERYMLLIRDHRVREGISANMLTNHSYCLTINEWLDFHFNLIRLEMASNLKHWINDINVLIRR